MALRTLVLTSGKLQHDSKGLWHFLEGCQ